VCARSPDSWGLRAFSVDLNDTTPGRADEGTSVRKADV
jgi:hypothetical protein